MNDDEKPKAPDGTPLQVNIEASDAADKAVLAFLRTSDHGWHGFECQICLGRYITCTTWFDRGYQHGIDEAEAFRPGSPRWEVPIIGQSKARDSD